MNLYLAGPMRGIPEFNFPQFHSAAAWLRGQGYEVFNPAEHDAQDTEARYSVDPLGVAREVFGRDTAWICAQADAVATLPGWHNSKGAKAEVALALALGLDVCYLHLIPSGEWRMTRAEDLE